MRWQRPSPRKLLRVSTHLTRNKTDKMHLFCTKMSDFFCSCYGNRRLIIVEVHIFIIHVPKHRSSISLLSLHLPTILVHGILCSLLRMHFPFVLFFRLSEVSHSPCCSPSLFNIWWGFLALHSTTHITINKSNYY
jgi:hypothetical protein